MKTFPYVEDYLLFIGGWIDNNGKSTNNYWSVEPVIKLANYDVGFITSVTEEIMHPRHGTFMGLTTRQVELAKKIIMKYERQLAKFSIGLPSAYNCKVTPRQLDRSTALIRNGNCLDMRFPFDNARIQQVKDMAKDSQGPVTWDYDNKVWKFALTEYNLSWAYAFAKSANFVIDPEVEEMFNLITECEKEPYKIELTIQDGEPIITNCPQSMQDFIDNAGASGNLQKMMSLAGTLGFTVNQAIIDAMVSEYGETYVKMTTQREIEHEPNSSIDDVIEWALDIGRMPIVVYNPNFLKLNKTELAKYFKPEEVINIGMKDEVVTSVDPSIKLIYTCKVLHLNQRIPVLITYANLMHGAAKRFMLDNADKVVYHCTTLPR